MWFADFLLDDIEKYSYYIYKYARLKAPLLRSCYHFTCMSFWPFPSCYLRWSPVSSVSFWSTEQPPQSDTQKLISLPPPSFLSSSPPWLSSLRTLGLIPSCSSSRPWSCSVWWRDYWSAPGSYSDTSATSLSLTSQLWINPVNQDLPWSG